MSSTWTPNLALQKPEHRDPDTYYSWDTVVNSNMDKVDAFLGQKTYTEQNFISNGDSITQSLDKLDIELQDAVDLLPTQDQHDALPGPTGYAPSSANPYVTLSYLTAAPGGVDKKEVLHPEYAGATFALAPGGLNTGTLTTNSEVIIYGGNNYRFNYYQWTSSETDLNAYDVICQWTVPPNFLNFSTTSFRALQIDFKTQANDPTLSKIDVEISKDGVNTTSSLSNLTSPTLWYCNRFATATAIFDRSNAVLSTLSGGNTLNIRITMTAKDSYYVRVGAITIQYRGF